MKKRTVFLDRDGVINEVVYHKEMGIVDSPFTVEQFKILPDIGTAIHKLHELGFIIILISNQPGIAKDHHDMETFQNIRTKMINELARENISLDAEYYCFHHPEAIIGKYKVICECRKPKPGMILKAVEEHDIDLSQSWMIGDGINDIKTGANAGCRTILIGRMKCDLCHFLEKENVKPDFIAPNLYKASLIIESEVTVK